MSEEKELQQQEEEATLVHVIAQRIEEKLLPLATRLQVKHKEHEEHEKQRAAQRKREKDKLSILAYKIRELQEDCVYDGEYASLWEQAWNLYEQDEHIAKTRRTDTRTFAELLWNKFLGVAPLTTEQARERYKDLLDLYQVPALVLSSGEAMTAHAEFDLYDHGQKTTLHDKVILFDVILPDTSCRTFFISIHTEDYFGSVNEEGDCVAHTFLKKQTLRDRIIMSLPLVTDQQLTLGTSLVLAREISRMKKTIIPEEKD